MGRFAAVLLIAGAALGRFSVLMLIAGIAVPLVAASPVEPERSTLNGPSDFDLTSTTLRERAEPGERSAYPNEQPWVPVNDAQHPPRLLWSLTPASLVKVVPTKVRYKLKF
jgi:hypothetical protein